jgi:hypothetical protein
MRVENGDLPPSIPKLALYRKLHLASLQERLGVTGRVDFMRIRESASAVEP